MKKMQVEPKLVTIVRRDIPPKYQLAQTLHAGLQFALECPERFKQWDEDSKSVVCLSAANENALWEIIDRIDPELRSQISLFREPDLNNELTSIALYASYETRKKLSNLPLALKEVAA